MGRRIEIKIEPSIYLEACAYIEDSEVTMDESVLGKLTEEELEYVSTVKGANRYQLNEFAVHASSIDFDQVLTFMESLDIYAFSYYYYHEEFSKETYFDKDEDVLSKRKNLSLSILKKVKPYIESTFSNYDYDHILDRVFKMTSEKSPLNVAQDIMGKSFRRVSDYEVYFFVPVKYSYQKPSRLFDDRTLLQVIPMNDSPGDFTIDQMAEALKIIGDPTRLKIIQLLSSNSMYGKELAEALNMKAPTITHHIDQLNKIELLHLEKIGQIKSYSLNHRRYGEIVSQMEKIGSRL